MPDKKPKKAISVKGIDPEVLRRANVMAAEKGISLNKVLREYLEQLVQDYEKEKKLQDVK